MTVQDPYESNVILRGMRDEFVNKQIEVWGFDYISDLFDRGYEPQLMRDNDTGDYTWTWMQTSFQPVHKQSLVRV